MNVNHENMNEFTVIRLDGRLDAAAVRDHRDKLIELADSVAKGVILNLEQVDFIDSSGLGLIVSLVKRVREQSADLSICSLSPQAQSLFELTRMTRIFSIHPDETSALNAT